MIKSSNTRFYIILIVSISFSAAIHQTVYAQQSPLLLSDAIKTGLQNYQSIEAKRNFIKSSQAFVKNTKNEYLPNVVASLQQDYGKLNGPFGAFATALEFPMATAGKGLPSAPTRCRDKVVDM